MGKRHLIVPLVAILLLACAHKAAPLVKDRLRPSLVRIVALDQRHVQFTFSEDVDTTSAASAPVIFAGTDTLSVQATYRGLSGAELIAVTAPMKAVTYTAVGTVYDAAANPGTYRRDFIGTVRADTVAPWVSAAVSGRAQRCFKVRFNEMMDTTRLAYRVVPSIAVVATWTDGLGLTVMPIVDSLAPADTLEQGRVYYLWIREAYDITGNRTAEYVTWLTPDTTGLPYIIRGRALIGDSLVDFGYAFLEGPRIEAVGLLRRGEFSFSVPDSLPRIVFVTTPDGYTGRDTLRPGSLQSVPLSYEPCDIDTLLH